MLSDHPERIAGWPVAVQSRLRQEAVAQTAWELRHKALLTDLLAELSVAGVECRVLKGTALAYSLYPRAAQRARGDTDLLIYPAALDAARAVFVAAGATCDADSGYQPIAGQSQESWYLPSVEGAVHAIDLHWSLLNSPALDARFPLDYAFAQPRSLPALCTDACALPLDRALLHAGIHRAKSMLTPYYVDGRAYFGGDRLVWLMDIDLLWRALDGRQREAAVEQALAMGAGAVMTDALTAAMQHLQTPVPAALLDHRADHKPGGVSHYLMAPSRRRRLWLDLWACEGWGRRLRFLWARLVPSAAFLRSSYPEFARAPLAFLYLRRLFAIFVSPRQRSE